MNNIRKYRVWRSKTQEEMAEILGISIFKYRKIEAGETPRANILGKILEYFKVNYNQMFIDN